MVPSVRIIVPGTPFEKSETFLPIKTWKNFISTEAFKIAIKGRVQQNFITVGAHKYFILFINIYILVITSLSEKWNKNQ
jgi:hypothetical protein